MTDYELRKKSCR